MWNAKLDESQCGIKIARRNIHNLIYADDTTVTSESKEELNSLLMKVKVESENVGLKMGENNSKWSNWQTTNLKNIQATYAAQFQKNKRPNQKMGQRTK